MVKLLAIVVEKSSKLRICSTLITLALRSETGGDSISIMHYKHRRFASQEANFSPFEDALTSSADPSGLNDIPKKKKNHPNSVTRRCDHAVKRQLDQTPPIRSSPFGIRAVFSARSLVTESVGRISWLRGLARLCRSRLQLTHPVVLRPICLHLSP